MTHQKQTLAELITICFRWKQQGKRGGGRGADLSVSCIENYHWENKQKSTVIENIMEVEEEQEMELIEKG